MKLLLFAMSGLACLVISCSPEGNGNSEPVNPTIYAAKDAPAELKPYIAKATDAFADLKSRLAPKLIGALNEGGPVNAIPFCKDRSPQLHKDAEAKADFEIGRTSHRLRNPANAPREWMRAIIEAESGRAAADVPVKVVDLGDRVGVMAPIGTMKLCLQCHGKEGEVEQATRDALKKSYPEDKAMGFAVG